MLQIGTALVTISSASTFGAVNVRAAKACVALIMTSMRGLLTSQPTNAVRNAGSRSARSCLTPCAGRLS